MTGAGTDHTQPPMGGGPAIVLVRPQLAVNVGMTARAMANFGLSDLRIVDPSGHFVRKGAQAAASGAVYLLEQARIFQSVEAATADLHFLFATTARERGQGKPILLPEPAMAQCFARMAQGEAQGILFGPERTGLENDEIALADAVVTFPVNPAYASLNLAQAVLLMGYEHMRARGAVLPASAQTPWSPPAPRAMVHSFFDYLEGQLEEAGFFRPLGKQPVMRRNLRNIFHRIGLTVQDVRTLRGVVVRLVQGPRRRDG